MAMNRMILISSLHPLSFHPILKPKAKPATNDALDWKSAVKKSTTQFHKERIEGALRLDPVAFVV